MKEEEEDGGWGEEPVSIYNNIQACFNQTWTPGTRACGCGRAEGFVSKRRGGRTCSVFYWTVI